MIVTRYGHNKQEDDRQNMNLCIAPLFSGSGGNATYIGTESGGLLVDAGLSGSAIVSALAQIDRTPAELDGILVTHEHIDHIKGIGVLSRKYDLPVFANAETWEQMRGKLGRVAEKNIRIIDDGEFFVRDMMITPIPLSHDAANPTGYAVSAHGKKVAVMTDSGKVTKAMFERAAGSDIMILESNHDVNMLKCGKYPYHLKTRILSNKGHLSNADCGKAAAELIAAGVRGILLGHLSKENNFDELAYRTVYDTLISEGIVPGRDAALAVAKKTEVTGYFAL